MKRPHTDELLEYMPPDVKAEVYYHDPEGPGGFGPRLKHWLKTSSNPFVASWCDRVRVWYVMMKQQAEREQVRMSDLAREAYHNCTRGLVRHKAVIHPFLMAEMRRREGDDVWTDKSAVADTERQASKLFIN